MGATEKRRESGAGCRGIGEIWIRGAKVREFIRNRMGQTPKRRDQVFQFAMNLELIL